MAETLNEFDAALPCVNGYCSRISAAEFEQQSVETTEEELQKLITFIKDNPGSCYNIARKKKLDELDVLSSFKVKVMSAIKGDDYLKTYFPSEECKESMDELQEQMISAYNYAQEAKGSDRRFSKRLAEKRKLRNEPKSVCNPSATHNPPPPPPPPPPAVTSTASCEIFRKKNNDFQDCCKFPKSRKRKPSSSFVANQEELFESMRSVRGRGAVAIATKQQHTSCEDTLLSQQDRRMECELEPDKSCEETRPLENKENSSSITDNSLEKPSVMKTLKKSISQKLSRPKLFSLKNFKDEIVNGRLKLKSVNTERSDEMSTPSQLIRTSKANAANQEEDFPLFNQALVDKFRNARSPAMSPASSPSGTFDDSGFNSP